MQDLPLPGCRYCYKNPVEEGYDFCLLCLRMARMILYIREKSGYEED